MVLAARCRRFLALHVSPLGLLSLTLFRVVHHSHHAHLATARDEELWPFVVRQTPRWARRLAAIFELCFGALYTPLLFPRAFLRPGTIIRNRGIRRRIWAELALVVLVWATMLAAVAWWELWKFWLIMYLAPSVLAGNMQSLRKFTEHMGLTGSTPLHVTRTIVPQDFIGHLFAFSLFNEPYHDAHHRYPSVPGARLPGVTAALGSNSSEDPLIYSSYRKALSAMFTTLGDPRIGPQWQESPAPGIAQATILAEEGVP